MSDDDEFSGRRQLHTCGCGCLMGLMLGMLLAGGLTWAWITQQQTIRNPLADWIPPDQKLSEEILHSTINRMAESYFEDEDNVGLVIGIWVDGKAQVFGYGTRTRSSKQVPDGDTLFELGSIGKTFTSLLLADMHRRGELNWNDPLQSFLPDDIVLPSREIKLIDLATHSSGLPRLPPGLPAQPRNPLDPYRDYLVEQLHADLPQTVVEFRPGTQYAYSNFGMGLLGHLLARKANQPFEQLVVQRICEPLGMSNTRITLEKAQQDRVAQPHSDGHSVPVWDMGSLQGAGAFLSTANDMLIYLSAHLDDESTELQASMRLATEKRRPADDVNTSMGLGWHIISENALDIVTHNGGTGGSASYAAMLKPSRVAVIVLSNSSSSVDDIGRRVLYLLDRYARQDQ